MVFIFRIYINKIWYKFHEDPMDSLLKKIRKNTMTFQPVRVFCPPKVTRSSNSRRFSCLFSGNFFFGKEEINRFEFLICYYL